MEFVRPADMPDSELLAEHADAEAQLEHVRGLQERATAEAHEQIRSSTAVYGNRRHWPVSSEHAALEATGRAADLASRLATLQGLVREYEHEIEERALSGESVDAELTGDV